MPEGRWVLVLHTHLPYVLGHGRWPHGDAWLFEAAAESYLPLLEACEGLEREGIRPGFTIEISPVLGEQLDDPRFRTGLPAHLGELDTAAEADAARFAARGEDHLAGLAGRWRQRFERLARSFEERGGDLLGGFGRLAERGAVELATCARTHGLLPLLGSHRRVRSQVEEGAAWFARRFGRPARGMWMPECAYRPPGAWRPAHAPSGTAEDGREIGIGPEPFRPGNEQFLEEAGIDWTVVDAHLVTGGSPLGSYPVREAPPGEGRSAYRPHILGESTVRALPRDPATTVQVWSGTSGYPANPWYLEFHKKHASGGLRYWRVTGPEADLGEKLPYRPERVPAVIAEQAHHFAELVAATIAEAGAEGVGDPVVVSPYDTELFGHWWAEGVDWLVQARRALGRRGVRVSTASEAADRAEPDAPLLPPAGSWGDGGDFRVWDSPRTAEVWGAVYRTERLLEAVAARLPERPTEELRRVFRQLGRSVLLIESSDWPFLIGTGAAPEYAAARVREHEEDARSLARMAERLIGGEELSAENRRHLAAWAARDPLWMP